MSDAQAQAHAALVDQIIQKWEPQAKMTVEVFDRPAVGRYVKVWFSPMLAQRYRRSLFGSVSDLCFQIAGAHWTYPTILETEDEATFLVKPYETERIKGDM